MSTTNPRSQTTLGSLSGNRVVDGSSVQKNHYPSSYTLKLFRHQSIVAYADPKDKTFRTPANPPVETAAVRALNILEVTTIIATYLLPLRPIPRDLVYDDDNRTHHNIASFSRVCSSLYMSGMCILYRYVFWLPSIWYVLVDSLAMLGYPWSDTLVGNPHLLLFVLRLQYTKEALSDHPESVVAYKFRRFLFITAQVREMKLDNSDFAPTIFQYVATLLPGARSVLLPGLRTASWIDDEYIIPAFLSTTNPDVSGSRALSPPPGNLQSDGSPRDTTSLRTWLPFDATTIRTINLQMHALSSPTDVTANHELFFANIQRLRNECHSIFPRLEKLMFLACRHQYHKPSLLSRFIVNAIASFVLNTGAMPLSARIPQPPYTLPFKKEHVLGGAYLEGIVINGYASHAPVLNAEGETAEGDAPPGTYPVVSAHLVTSITTLAITCTTNLTSSSLDEKHTICRILSPAVDFLGLEHIILHLDTISLRLSHGDIVFFGKKWRNLRTLDLRFKTIVTNEHLDIVRIDSVQVMTQPDLADGLKRIHLPELDMRTFSNILRLRQDTLTSLTSSVLHFDKKRVHNVCVALLAAYPGLTTVTGPGSAPEWGRFARALESIQEKRRAERASREEWVRAKAAHAQIRDQ